MLAVTDKEQIESCLLDIIGSVLKAESWKYRCSKCRKQHDSWEDLDAHHVVYSPPMVKYLCHRDHVRVTYLNAIKARSLYRKLTNEERLEVWEEFLAEDTSKEDYEDSEYEMQDWFDE